MNKELIELRKQAAIAAMQSLIISAEKDYTTVDTDAVARKAMEYAVSMSTEWSNYHPTFEDGDIIHFRIDDMDEDFTAIWKNDESAYVVLSVPFNNDRNKQLFIYPDYPLKEEYESYRFIRKAEKEEIEELYKELRELGLMWDANNKTLFNIDTYEKYMIEWDGYISKK